MSNINHLVFEKIADMAENRLPENERADAVEHIDQCASCAAQLTRLETVTNLMRTDKAEDAPRDLVIWAKGMFRAQGAVIEKRTLARRILAALTFDSAQLSAAVGLRSSHAAGRQVMFSAGDTDIDLRIMPSDDKWILSGQLLGECGAGRVELRGETETLAATISEFCEFTFPPTSSGSYTLVLSLAEMEIEVPSLMLQ